TANCRSRPISLARICRRRAMKVSTCASPKAVAWTKSFSKNEDQPECWRVGVLECWKPRLLRQPSRNTPLLHYPISQTLHHSTTPSLRMSWTRKHLLDIE